MDDVASRTSWPLPDIFITLSAESEGFIAIIPLLLTHCQLTLNILRNRDKFDMGICIVTNPWLFFDKIAVPIA